MRNWKPWKQGLRRVAVMGLCVLCLTEPARSILLFPDVTEEMSDAAFWSAAAETPDAVLAGPEEIAEVNAAYLAETDSNMHNLRNVPDTFNGVERVAALRRSLQADAEYYMGWTYAPDGRATDQAFFDPIIENSADPGAQEEMPVRFGITVNRTMLMSFPTDIPLPDDPADPDFEYRSLVGLRVNEPVAVYTTSQDGKYYQVRNTCCSGWAAVEDIAICADRAEWLSAWDIPAEKRLVVCGDKWYTDSSHAAPETANRYLTMGTVLEKADAAPGALVGNRLSVHNYAVYLPVRESDGTYRKQAALLNARAPVSEGYLPLTAANIAKTAFSALGNAYGWGGMMDNEDCTSYLRNVYACFGLDLPRNGNWQWAAHPAGLDLSNTATEEKEAMLDRLPLGTLLTFPGHQMMYLGKAGGKYYVISSVSSIMSPWQEGTRQRVRSLCVNTLEIKRASGHTWIQDLTRAYLPWRIPAEGGETGLPSPLWYHEAVAFCLAQGALTAEAGGYLRLSDAASRGEVVEMLWKLCGSPDPSPLTMPFQDTPEGTELAKAAQWARDAGIVNGATETTFSPDNHVTRQQFAAFLYRGIEPKEESSGLDAFPDAGMVSEWARDAMSWCVESGLVQGTAEGLLHPQGNITRAQAAVILYRLEQLTQGVKAAIERGAAEGAIVDEPTADGTTADEAAMDEAAEPPADGTTAEDTQGVAQ